MSHKDVSFEIGELVITLSVDEVKKRYGIDQGFGFPGVDYDPIICRVVEKDFIWGNWMIKVEPIEEGHEHMKNCWNDQYIYESYVPLYREERFKQLLDK